MIDPQSNSSFAELYMLDERKFANESVKALLFSNRTAKRLRQAGVITIMDLLRMTPAMMMKIEGFGIGCLEEIERELQHLMTVDLQRLRQYRHRHPWSHPIFLHGKQKN